VDNFMMKNYFREELNGFFHGWFLWLLSFQYYL
jgi:hypothetical protein